MFTWRTAHLQHNVLALGGGKSRGSHGHVARSPGGPPGTGMTPASSVLAVRVSPVAGLFRVTMAPVTTAPFASEMVPWRDVVADLAEEPNCSTREKNSELLPPAMIRNAYKLLYPPVRRISIPHPGTETNRKRRPGALMGRYCATVRPRHSSRIFSALAALTESTNAG